MNPWWRRPNPERGASGGADQRSDSQTAAARESEGPAAIEDSLEPLPDLPEDDEDFEEEAAPRSKRKRSRRKRRRRNGADKSDAPSVRSTATDEPISAALVDVEALADTLRALSIDLDDDCSFAQVLACSGEGTINSAYANGNRHARLQRVLADAGFAIQETTGGTQGLRLRLAVDTVDLAHRAAPGALLLSGNHETMELLAERLAELERPMITAHDHLTRSTGATESADDSADQDGAEAAEDADSHEDTDGDERQPQRRSRRGRGGRRGRGPRRSAESRDGRDSESAGSRRAPVAASQNNGDAIALLDRALESLVDAGPQVVWATLVRQTMLRLDPEFDERRSGYDGFADLLEAAANDGIIRLQDDERTGSQVVVAWGRPTAD